MRTTGLEPNQRKIGHGFTVNTDQETDLKVQEYVELHARNTLCKVKLPTTSAIRYCKHFCLSFSDSASESCNKISANGYELTNEVSIRAKC